MNKKISFTSYSRSIPPVGAQPVGAQPVGAQALMLLFFVFSNLPSMGHLSYILPLLAIFACLSPVSASNFNLTTGNFFSDPEMVGGNLDQFYKTYHDTNISMAMFNENVEAAKNAITAFKSSADPAIAMLIPGGFVPVSIDGIFQSLPTHLAIGLQTLYTSEEESWLGVIYSLYREFNAALAQINTYILAHTCDHLAGTDMDSQCTGFKEGIGNLTQKLSTNMNDLFREALDDISNAYNHTLPAVPAPDFEAVRSITDALCQEWGAFLPPSAKALEDSLIIIQKYFHYILSLMLESTELVDDAYAALRQLIHNWNQYIKEQETLLDRTYKTTYEIVPASRLRSSLSLIALSLSVVYLGRRLYLAYHKTKKEFNSIQTVKHKLAQNSGQDRDATTTLTTFATTAVEVTRGKLTAFEQGLSKKLDAEKLLSDNPLEIYSAVIQITENKETFVEPDNKINEAKRLLIKRFLGPIQKYYLGGDDYTQPMPQCRLVKNYAGHQSDETDLMKTMEELYIPKNQKSQQKALLANILHILNYGLGDIPQDTERLKRFNYYLKNHLEILNEATTPTKVFTWPLLVMLWPKCTIDLKKQKITVRHLLEDSHFIAVVFGEAMPRIITLGNPGESAAQAALKAQRAQEADAARVIRAAAAADQKLELSIIPTHSKQLAGEIQLLKENGINKAAKDENISQDQYQELVDSASTTTFDPKVNTDAYDFFEKLSEMAYFLVKDQEGLYQKTPDGEYALVAVLSELTSTDFATET